MDPTQRIHGLSILNILSHKNFFVLSGLNPTSLQYRAILIDLLRKHKARISLVRSSLFREMIECTKFAAMGPLFTGPTFVVFTNRDFRELAPLVKYLKSQGRILLLGAKIEDDIVSVEDLLNVINMPPKERLYEEMLGSLSQPAAAVAGLLSQPSSLLAFNLEQYVKQTKE